MYLQCHVMFVHTVSNVSGKYPLNVQLVQYMCECTVVADTCSSLIIRFSLSLSSLGGHMMNGGDPSHQGYPGQPSSMQTSSGQYQMPPTPASNMNPPSVTGNSSPHPNINSDLPPGFPPTPIHSVDVKKEHPNPNDPSAQISIPSLPSSVKSEFKTELLSPTYPPGSITAPPLSQQQQIKTELNPSIPPPSDNIPSVPQSTGEFCIISTCFSTYNFLLILYLLSL